jgi:O-acetyl-ADP-ribose deacetylase (regulator of RNase III)/ADP-ribose pyrophosphatase YjhB (NUDIX family)
MKIKNTEIRLLKEDITRLKVDAIVNAANNKLIMGGGVAGVIKRQGGNVIEEEAVKKGPIKIGQAIATGAGTLPSKFVIHAATMGMDFKTDEIKIRDAARSALTVAEELKLSSIAIPALGCGVGGFPHLASAKIIAQEVFRHLREGKSGLKEIIFCLHDKEAFEAFDKGLIRYLIHASEVLQNGPFVTVDAIIELDGGIVIIKRSNPPFGWALPGGFVDYGESLEGAVVREAKEETGLTLAELRQFHTYSEPTRDPRFHTIGTVFIAKGQGDPKPGDDAASLKVIKLNDIGSLDFAFDHRKILEDYICHKKGKDPF